MKTINISQDKDRFEALFEFASMGILIANGSGIIEEVNLLLIQQFGYEKKEDLVGRNVEDLIPRRFGDRHRQHREGFVANPERRTMGTGRDLYGLKKDGTEMPVEVSLSHFIENNQFFVIAFVIDISRRKEIEQAVLRQKEELAANVLKIERLNDELEEKVAMRTKQLKETMEHLEASRDELTRALNKEKELSDLKSRFVSMASHEFRTPLSTILSSASLLAKYTEAEEQDKRDKHIGRIKSSVNNLSGILNEFLSIGRIEDGKIVIHEDHFNIRELVISICQEIKVLAKSKQRIEYTFSGGEMVTLDSSLLRNILINLLSNAIKFSHEDGLIRVSVDVTDEHITLNIQDQGIGISAKDQEHLFERFFRATNATNIPGTGLGLHIVAKYVELMHGQVQFSSELEKGTCFTITFQTQTQLQS
jgi:PAS domain S-box-containing protein